MVGCQCDDQLRGSGRSIAGPWHPTQQWHAQKASRKTALSFLQTLHCSLYIDTTKIGFCYLGLCWYNYLTSNKEGRRRTSLVDWTWHQAPLQGAVDVVPLLGAIVVCWPTNIGGVDVVSLLGAIVVCYGGGRRPTLGEWTWCHCRVPLSCAMVGEGRSEGDGQVGGVDVVPCHCSVLWLGASVTTNFGGVDVVRNGIQKNCLELFADVTLFSALITQKLVLLSGVYAGIIGHIFFVLKVSYSPWNQQTVCAWKMDVGRPIFKGHEKWCRFTFSGLLQEKTCRRRSQWNIGQKESLWVCRYEKSIQCLDVTPFYYEGDTVDGRNPAPPNMHETL